MIRVLIADDELPARQRLRQLLVAHSDFEVVAEAETGAQTMELVAQFHPDLLLLDIQMADGTGLDVAACLPMPRPAIIFCTAFDQHAVDAFELNAIDYLLKPVSRFRLEKALARVPARDVRQSETTLERIFGEPQQRLARFLVRNESRYLVVPANETAYFESVDGLTRLVTKQGKSYWMDPPLQEIEQRLDPRQFFRISRAALVNLNVISEVHPFPGGSAAVLLKTGGTLEVSRRRLKDLLKILEEG
jgi:two-component system LytT family response regulator